MTTLYRPVRVTNDAQRAALPKGSFMHPNCYMGGPVTYLVPIEAEEESTHEMRTSRGVENFAPSHGIFPVPSRRLVTPWEEA